MAANIEEKVIEKLRVLPEDQKAEVLKFVEDLADLEVCHGQTYTGTKAQIVSSSGSFVAPAKSRGLVFSP